MATRVNKWVARFEVGEVVPEDLCQWDARRAGDLRDSSWEEWGRTHFSPGGYGHGWWARGWGYMHPQGQVKEAAIHIACDPALLDKFFEPEENEWGTVCP